MVTIPLTQGKVAVVDDEDAELSQLRWHVLPGRRTTYAKRNARRDDGRRETEQLHRAVWARAHPDEPIPIQLDHRDGNGLNCRRENLRPATRSENIRNQRVRITNTSGFKGVCWQKTRCRWQAQIGVTTKGDRTNHWLGYFATHEDAARAYDDAARKLHGEFAALNFPCHNERSAIESHVAVGDPS